MKTIKEINEMASEEFQNYCIALLEHCEWALPEFAEMRPFLSLEDAQEKIRIILSQASDELKMVALKGHPALAAGQAQEGFSQDEQKQAGLNQLSEPEYAEFSNLNEQYLEKHGFPYIIAVTGLSKETIFEDLRHRLPQSTENEFSTASEEVIKIAEIRIAKLMC